MYESIFIETPRLIIKNINEKDFSVLRPQQKDPGLMEFFGGPREDSKITKILDMLYKHLIVHGFSQGPVFNKKTGECIGRAGLIKLDFDDQSPYVELAYFLLPQYWRQGFGSELAKALVEYAFNVLKVPKVYATIDPHNIASRKISEHLGMYPEKEDVYAILDKKVIYYSIKKEDYSIG